MAIAKCRPDPRDDVRVEVTFRTCALPGCPCAPPLPVNHQVRLIVLTGGIVYSQLMGDVGGESRCYEASISLGGPAKVYALCGPVGDSGEIDVPVAESEHIDVTQADLNKCWTAP